MKKILLADDEPSVRLIVQTTLESSNYECHSAVNGKEAVEKAIAVKPDLILMDVSMPEMNGFEACRQIRSHPAIQTIPILMLTSEARDTDIEEGQESGATGYFLKPFRPLQLLKKVEEIITQCEEGKEFNLEEAKERAREVADLGKCEDGGNLLNMSQQQVVEYAKDLNQTIDKLKEKNKELKESYVDTIHRLVKAAEYKDVDTGSHVVRISNYSALLARYLGLSAEEIETIFYASPMHDIGKIGIPDGILMKPGKLTTPEFEVMKNHTIMGAKILAGSKSEILKLSEKIAISHHEKWNGKGYPDSLEGEEIPLEGRIVAVADVFDALTSRRPYKEPFSTEAAVNIIREDSGQHFDPKVVDVFLEHISEIIKLKEEIEEQGE